MVDLSIIIVNTNTVQLLCECIQSVNNTAENLDFEIIVVDNASVDDSVEIVHSMFPEVKVVANSENLGFSRSANLALADTVGDFFLFAHPDILFLPGAIIEMLSYLKSHPRVGIVGSNQIYPDGSYVNCCIAGSSVRRELVEFDFPIKNIDKIISQLTERFGKERASIYWDHKNVTESETIYNACMMFRREVLENVGNFCEDFFVWWADMDFCLRARNAGWKAFYLPDAKVIHYETRSHSKIDLKLVKYKVDVPVAKGLMRKDHNTLLKRYNSPIFFWLSNILYVLALWKSKIKYTFVRVFAS